MIRRPQRRTSSGFTLIELLVVIAIIGIVSAIAVGNYRNAIVKAKEATLREDLFQMRTLINQYFADKGRYPTDLHALVEDRYLRKIPIDPITQSADTWVTDPAETTEGDLSVDPGIADVFSGATGVGTDGTPYAEW